MSRVPHPFLRFLLLLLLLPPIGCSVAKRGQQPVATPEVVTWSGEVFLEESVSFGRGSRLIIEPGTTVRFGFGDEDDDGWGDVSIMVEGDLEVRGTLAAPVVFTTVSPKVEPGGWGEVRVDFGRVEIRYAIFEGATRGLHGHFISGSVTDSVFRDNVDGTRIGESRVTFERNLFTNNVGKGYNARTSQNVIARNIFRSNNRALFLFEGDEGSSVTKNLFVGNKVPVRLGDFYVGRMSMSGNVWSKDPLPTVSPENPDGSLAVDPAASVEGIEFGPRGWRYLVPTWSVDLGGYVDGAPAVVDEGVYAGSWSGMVARVGLFDGAFQARTDVGDFVDASIAVGDRYVAVQAWDRSVQLMDRHRLMALDRFIEVESGSDDHRQATPLFEGDALYVGTWAGNVHNFDVSSGRLKKVWTIATGGPIRGGPAAVETDAGGWLLLVPSSDGKLYGLNLENGGKKFEYDGGAPLISAVLATSSRAYVADRGGQLHAVSIPEGKAVWKVGLGGPAWYAPTHISTDGSYVYQGDDSGAVSCFDAASGELVWRRILGGGVRMGVAIGPGGDLVVGALDGTLNLLDPRGNVVDKLKFTEPLHSMPAIKGNHLVFGGRDNMLRGAILVDGEAAGRAMYESD